MKKQVQTNHKPKQSQGRGQIEKTYGVKAKSQIKERAKSSTNKKNTHKKQKQFKNSLIDSHPVKQRKSYQSKKINRLVNSQKYQQSSLRKFSSNHKKINEEEEHFVDIFPTTQKKVQSAEYNNKSYEGKSQKTMKKIIHAEQNNKNQFMVNEYIEQIQKLKKRQQQMSANYQSDIKKYCFELQQQKMKSQKLLKHLSHHQQNNHISSNNQNSNKDYELKRIKELQEDVNELEEKCATFQIIKIKLEQKIKEQERQKQYIKKQSKEILQSIHQQIDFLN